MTDLKIQCPLFIRVNSPSIDTMPPRLSNCSLHWVRIWTLPLPLATWNVNKMDNSRQSTAITKISLSLLFIQTLDNFYSVPHKMFTMESNDFFIQNPNMDIWKKILFFMKPGSNMEVFILMKVSQIKLSSQHWIWSVFHAHSVQQHILLDNKMKENLETKAIKLH